MRTVAHLAGKLGPRAAGGKAEHLAAEYIAAELSGMGVSFSARAFVFRGWRPRSQATILVRHGSGHESRILCLQLPYSAATTPQGETGRIVRQGTWAIIPGRLECPRFLVLDESGQPRASVVASPVGSARPYPNPLPLLVLPTACVSEEAGRELARLTEEADRLVTVICAPAWEGPLWSRNVIAHIGRDDKVIVICAHYDSVEGSAGANDNASGVAVLLRLASRLRDFADQSVGFRLVFYGAEEPLFVGSRSDVADLAVSGALSSVLACLNLDMVAVGDEFNVRCAASSVWARASRELLAHPCTTAPVRVVPEASASDHWAFHEAGIDSAQLTRVPDVEYHLRGDMHERVTPGALNEAENIAWALLVSVVDHLGMVAANDA